MRSDGLNRTKTGADVDIAWVAALLDKKINNLMRNKQPKNEFKYSSDDDDLIMMITRSKIKGLIAKKVDRVQAERTHAVQTQIEDKVVDMLQLGCSVA